MEENNNNKKRIIFLVLTLIMCLGLTLGAVYFMYYKKFIIQSNSDKMIDNYTVFDIFCR